MRLHPRHRPWPRAVCLLALWLWLWQPGAVRGHGAEFVFAKLDPYGTEHAVRLTANVEISGLSSIRDAESAKAALAGLILLDGAPLNPSPGSGPEWDEFEHWSDTTAPVPVHGPGEDSTGQRWVRATWKIPLPVSRPTFLEVASTAKLAVVLWETSMADEETRWRILLPGDRSFPLQPFPYAPHASSAPPSPSPPRAPSPGAVLIAFIAATALSAIFWYGRREFSRTRRFKSPGKPRSSRA